MARSALIALTGLLLAGCDLFAPKKITGTTRPPVIPSVTPQQLVDGIFDEGYSVDQVMTFKMREGDDDLWRIVRWLDDPLSTDCGEGESAKPAGTTSFSSVKASARDRS